MIVSRMIALGYKYQAWGKFGFGFDFGVFFVLQYQLRLTKQPNIFVVFSGSPQATATTVLGNNWRSY